MMKLLSATLAGAAALCLAAASWAQEPDATPPVVPDLPDLQEQETAADIPLPDPGPAEGLDAADVEAWLDGYMPYALASGDIAGAVVTVVSDGDILLSKGYGYADIETRTPVDPSRTLFRPGSVSKLITWTAVMQLAEQGRIDLDADINTYLDFDIPAIDGPVTLRHVLRHTPGFQESVKYLMLDSEEGFLELGEYLRGNVPEVLFPAGEVPAYSNYATALAGHIVAEVSGMSFDDYVEANIFEPLGMTRSTFRQPLPEGFDAEMSSGYMRASDGDPRPFEMVTPAPAGSMSATGDDMGRFMIAHLAGGGPILGEDAARAMHTEADRKFPPLNAMTLGFYEQDRNGVRSVGHGGDTTLFHSNLHLYLDEGVGLYISMNSTGRNGASGRIRNALFEGFTDRYFPVEADERPTLDTAAEHGRMMAGSYENSRVIRTNFLASVYLMGQIKVGLNADDELVTDFMRTPAGAPKRWREVEPFVWQEVGGADRLAARVEDGRVTGFSMEPVSPFMAFTPVPWQRSSALLMPLIGIALGALALTVVLWPVRAVVRWRYRAPFPLEGRRAWAWRAVRLGALLSLAHLGLWMFLVTSSMSNLSRMTDALEPWVLALLIGAIIPLSALAVSVWNAVAVWTGPSSWFGKAWSLVIVASFVILVWFLAAAGFLSFTLAF